MDNENQYNSMTAPDFDREQHEEMERNERYGDDDEETVVINGTADELRQVIHRTRQENGGITINLIARIFDKEFDSTEIHALINELELILENHG